MATAPTKQTTPIGLPLGKNGYPEKEVKTSGINTRGNGAAIKGTKARGPMA